MYSERCSSTCWSSWKRPPVPPVVQCEWFPPLRSLTYHHEPQYHRGGRPQPCNGGQSHALVSTGHRAVTGEREREGWNSCENNCESCETWGVIGGHNWLLLRYPGMVLSIWHLGLEVKIWSFLPKPASKTSVQKMKTKCGSMQDGLDKFTKHSDVKELKRLLILSSQTWSQNPKNPWPEESNEIYNKLKKGCSCNAHEVPFHSQSILAHN